MLATAPRTLPSDLRQLTSQRPERPVPLVQGTYYLLIGLGSILISGSLGAVIGADGGSRPLWVFGLVVASVGAVLLLAAKRREVISDTARLGVKVALGLAAGDVALVFSGAAPPIYLADAAVQAVFVLWWGRARIPHDPELVGGLHAGLT
jgi:hypothetical protein